MKSWLSALVALAVLYGSMIRAQGEVPVRICALTLEHAQELSLPLLRPQARWAGQDPAVIYRRFRILFDHWFEIGTLGRPLSDSALVFIRKNERVPHLGTQEVVTTYFNKLRMEWVGIERLMRELAIKDLELRDFPEGFTPHQREFLVSALAVADGIDWWVRRLPGDTIVADLMRVYSEGYRLDSKDKVTSLLDTLAFIERGNITSLTDLSHLSPPLVSAGFAPPIAAALVNFTRTRSASTYSNFNTAGCCRMSCADCPINYPFKYLNNQRKNEGTPAQKPKGSTMPYLVTWKATYPLQDAAPISAKELELYRE